MAVAAIRDRAVPRRLGWFSAVLGAMLVLFGTSPLQYMAGFFGPLWKVVTSLGFLLGDKSAR